MSEKIFPALKFVFFILLIPVLIGVTHGFIGELQLQKPAIVRFFAWGVIGYLIAHLMVAEPSAFYRAGHKITADVFRFFEPLVEVGPYFVPIYTVLTLIIFYFVRLMGPRPWQYQVFMFTAGFTLTMHFIFSARELRDKDANAVKPNYLFAMAIIYLFNMLLVALLLDLALPKFSFGHFFSEASQAARAIYSRVAGQLFGV